MRTPEEAEITKLASNSWIDLNIAFKKKVLIGDKFEIETLLHDYKRGIASFLSKASVKGKKVCQAEFDLVLPEEINKFKLKCKDI